MMYILSDSKLHSNVQWTLVYHAVYLNSGGSRILVGGGGGGGGGGGTQVGV